MTTFVQFRSIFSRTILITLFLFLGKHAFSEVVNEEASTKVRFGGIAEVTFPSEPTSSFSDIQDEHILNVVSGSYQARYLKSKMDKTIQWGPEENLKKFYSEYLKGMADGIKGRVISGKYIKIKGYMALDAIFIYHDPMGREIKMISRSITLNGKFYSIVCANLTSEYEYNTATREEFFNSFEIGIDPKDVISKSFNLSSSESQSTGSMIWRMVIMIFSIVSITIGAVYFSTRKSKVEKANEVSDL
ncbi:MAG: hypothetical protein COA38_21165 [Fluviicola sp.]|nr:MAG: hypothetical protein COA38_21165 [Fluviicola sp.]